MNTENNILITKWLNNTISEAELKQFKALEDYDLYLRIMECSSKLQAPEYDVDKAFEAILKQKETKRSHKKGWWKYGAVASIVFLIGFFSYNTFFGNTTYTTDFGNQLAFELPDGSKVLLNAKSTITFNKQNWETNRLLTLDGEAFFDVEKGNHFKVQTKQGDVTVLGTEFTVNATTNFFKVACFEGKVKVEDKIENITQLLLPNQGYQQIESTVTQLQFKNLKPSWLNDQSSFKSVPVKYVFKSLEKQYNLKFEYKNFNDSVLFTGSFPNNNKNNALQTVLKSVNITYEIQENRVILQD